MDLYPSIDLRAGQVVRLYQGDYAQETVYEVDPIGVATKFADAGARWTHIVDLDAARSGEPLNRPVITAIVEAVAGRMRVQASGGVRTDEAAAALAEAGVARVVIGTAALEDPALVARVAERQPVAVGLDGRQGEVALRGWVEGSGQGLLDVVPRFADIGVEALVVTEISRDGTFAGPDVDGLAAVMRCTSLPVIASGGVGSLRDLEALAALEVGGRHLAGAVVGRALYEGRIALGDALAALTGR
ncbi:MAG TPA: HisA/HisF-related TIM barrel protein [Acidimicrobiales bacterium]|nr:HisA/HisF-related TIM barrel protein [Acidimicrobiales bacterium]